MKLTRFALAAAIACCLGFNSVPASDYYDQPSSSDQPPSVDKLIQAPAGGYACDDAGDDAPACEPWRLCCQKECGWNVYGFVDAGAASNFDDFWNGPVTFPDRSDGMLNQLYLITEKTIDTGGCGCDWGGRVDLLYGSDYIFTQATGLETRGDGSPKWNSDPFYGLAMPQAYLELGYNDWSLKLGHFYTPIGYEVVPANGNFFYTHSYTMQYGEPFTHTGGLATYKYNDRTNLVIGFVNGWDNFDRDNDTGAIVGGFTWNNGDRLSISLMGIASPNEPRSFLLQVIDAPELDTNRDMYSLVISYQINDCWQYVFQHDLGYQRDGEIHTGTMSAEWYGINQYLFYTINDCWKAGGRFEWFRDDDGARIAAVRPNNPTAAGFHGNFFELTLGLNWTPHANFIVRPEVRYDWFDGGTFSPRNPFDNGFDENDNDQFLAALDVIFLW